jgi:sulfur-oxidizing protein SoxX
MPRRRARSRHAASAALLLSAAAHAGAAPPVPRIEVVGDAIPRPLTRVPGDPVRGRAIVADRQVGLCLLCHPGPFADGPTGDLAPDLAGAGARWSEGQLRLRIVDARRVDPASLMPSFHRIDGKQRVGAAWRGRPVLDAQQVEDVVAFLRALRD